MPVYNRFPVQRPSFEIEHELLAFVGIQLNILVDEIEHYHTHQPTLSRHREQIRLYLGLRRFDDEARAELEEFLREEGILQPAADTLRRLIVTQRQAARDHIYERIASLLSELFQAILDELTEACVP